MKETQYGVELIMDLSHCDVSKFTKEELSNYFVELCDLIEMERYGEPMYWHDDSDDPILRGASGVQFIQTSNIVIHGCELLEAAFVNIFSCKEFDIEKAKNFTANYFGSSEISTQVIERKYIVPQP